MNLKFMIPALCLTLSSVAFAIPEAIDEPAEAQSQTQEQTSTELTEEQQYQAWAEEVWASLTPQTGEIQLSGTGATLNVPEAFYFLNPQDSERVLSEVWGNPPGQETLGMLFPKDSTPFDDGAWAVTVEYHEDGYVSDEDADEIDYDDLLEEMKADTKLESEEWVKQGYSTISLIGWAAPPFYDSEAKKLHWAKELKFGGEDINTLNYNIRILGRKGVLILNFIAGMDQKELIESNLDAVLDIADFDQGSRYSDFNPELDQVAAYGLGALVAGKVIAKTGFLAAALIFLKKFGIIIVLGLVALVKGVLSRKKKS